MAIQTPTFRAPKTAELIATSVRAEIAAGRLRPGDRMPAEAELMASYGVSRPTLREALRMLEHDEIIEIRRGAHGGATVRTPSTAPLSRALGDALMLQPGWVDADKAYVPLDEDDLAWLAATVRRAARKRAGDSVRARAVA
jgi:DNA-binding FadR family transcriptional regulator